MVRAQFIVPLQKKVEIRRAMSSRTNLSCISYLKLTTIHYSLTTNLLFPPLKGSASQVGLLDFLIAL